MVNKLKCWRVNKIDGNIFALSPRKPNKDGIVGYSITEFVGGLSVNEFGNDGRFNERKLFTDKKGFDDYGKAEKLMFGWAKKHDKC